MFIGLAAAPPWNASEGSWVTLLRYIMPVRYCLCRKKLPRLADMATQNIHCSGFTRKAYMPLGVEHSVFGRFLEPSLAQPSPAQALA